MEYLAIFIPILAAIVLLIFFREKVTPWEYLAILGPSVVLIVCLHFVFVSSNTSDTEYVGMHITEVRHYDAWDEWVKKTCSYQTCSGGKVKSCTTHYYDCSYRDFHEEYWVMIDNFGNEYGIDKKRFNSLKKRYASPETFVEMDRDFYQIDVDAQQWSWLNELHKVESITKEQDYVNKVKASSSIFKFEDIDQKEKAQFKLYDYPSVSNLNQSTILGVKVPLLTQRRFDYINGVLGPKKQIRVFVLYFYDQPVDASFKQRSYWQGGNKNELIICLGVNSVTGKLNWTNSFSWMKKPELETRIRGYFSDKEKADLNIFAVWLTPHIERYWERRSFKEFDYLEVHLSDKQLLWVFILVGIYNILASVIAVGNSLNNRVINKAYGW